MIVLPMIIMFVLGVVFTLLTTPYIRKYLHTNVDNDLEVEELKKTIKILKEKLNEYEKTRSK